VNKILNRLNAQQLKIYLGTRARLINSGLMTNRLLIYVGDDKIEQVKSRHAKTAAEHFYMNTSIETMAKLDRCGVKAVGVGYEF